MWRREAPRSPNPLKEKIWFDFKSTKTPEPPLQERILHVYKFIYVSEIGVCTYTCKNIFK